MEYKNLGLPVTAWVSDRMSISLVRLLRVVFESLLPSCGLWPSSACMDDAGDHNILTITSALQSGTDLVSWALPCDKSGLYLA